MNIKIQEMKFITIHENLKKKKKFFHYPTNVLSFMSLVISSRPVTGSKHRFFSNPANSCSPAIANTNRKNITTITEFIISGVAEKSVIISILRFFIDEIVLKGLKTLKDLKTLRFTPLLLEKR